MNHIMAVCDAEEEYASRLTDYINRKEGFPFRVRYFSTLDKLIQFAGQQKVEVVLISEEYQEVLHETGLIEAIIVLSTKSGEWNNSQYRVYKYQSGESLIKAILQILAESMEGKSHISRRVSLKVIGLYSPVKRCLQTTFGLTMGQLLAKKGKVLYINMEGFSGLNVMLKRNFQRDL